MKSRHLQPKTRRLFIGACGLMATMLAFLLLRCGNAHSSSQTWESVAPGMVLTRNFMVPAWPWKDGYRSLPENYQLGRKAYARQPPAWWLAMVREAGVDPRWNSKDFPLAYAGEFTSKTGDVALLVVQVSHKFSGDGSLSPNSQLYLIARLFSTVSGKPKLLKEEAYCLGSMQYECLMAGERKGQTIVFRIEGGDKFDSRIVTITKRWVLTVGDDHSLTMTPGP